MTKRYNQNEIALFVIKLYLIFQYLLSKSKMQFTKIMMFTKQIPYKNICYSLNSMNQFTWNQLMTRLFQHNFFSMVCYCQETFSLIFQKVLFLNSLWLCQFTYYVRCDTDNVIPMCMSCYAGNRLK